MKEFFERPEMEVIDIAECAEVLSESTCKAECSSESGKYCLGYGDQPCYTE